LYPTKGQIAPLTPLASEGWKMKFHVTGTSGSEDPTRATLVFLHAKGAKEAGHDVSISLLGDSVVMLNPAIAKNIQGVGLPPLTELINFAKENGIPVYG
jgi:predicted peroxiredoxin